MNHSLTQVQSYSSSFCYQSIVSDIHSSQNQSSTYPPRPNSLLRFPQDDLPGSFTYVPRCMLKNFIHFFFFGSAYILTMWTIDVSEYTSGARLGGSGWRRGFGPLLAYCARHSCSGLSVRRPTALAGGKSLGSKRVAHAQSQSNSPDPCSLR